MESLYLCPPLPHSSFEKHLRNRKLECFFEEIFGSPQSKVDHVKQIKNSLMEREGKDWRDLEITYLVIVRKICVV